MLSLQLLPLVNQVAITRDALIQKLRHVERGEFVVTIGGEEREDEETKRRVKPVLQRVLRERIGSLDRDLEAYGVDVC